MDLWLAAQYTKFTKMFKVDLEMDCWIVGKTYIQYLENFLQVFFFYIFILFGQWTMTFTFYLPTFSNIFSNRFFNLFLSHLNIISLFIFYSYFNTRIFIPSSQFLSLLIFILFYSFANE